MGELRSSNHAFRTPPVFEMALAVQFDELEQFRTVHFGKYASLIDAEFPVSEDQPRAARIEEDFPNPMRHFSVTLVPSVSGPERVWFRDKPDGNFLLQLQPDRFGLNWRRGSNGDDYPRFQTNGMKFLAEFEKLRRFTLEQNLGPVRPNLCEVVYVNHIFPVAGQTSIDCFQWVLANVSLAGRGSLSALPELATFNRVYSHAERRERLYLEAGIGKHQGRGNFVLLKVTSRVVMNAEDDLGAKLQQAHDLAVEGFVDATTAEAKRDLWGYGP